MTKRIWKVKQANHKLLNAARTGNMKGMMAALDAGADVNARDRNQNTPLIEATCDGHLHLARLLIASGADVNAKNNCQDTPLLGAAIGGYADFAQLLIDNGADINAKNYTEWSAMDYAVAREHTAVIAVLEKAIDKQGSHVARVERSRKKSGEREI